MSLTIRGRAYRFRGLVKNDALRRAENATFEAAETTFMLRLIPKDERGCLSCLS